MFGIGFSEIALIALILIVFIKPEDLPAFFRKLGRLYAQAKNAYKEVTAVKDEFLREMDIAAAVQDADTTNSEAPKTGVETPKSGSEVPSPEVPDSETRTPESAGEERPAEAEGSGEINDKVEE